MNEYFYEVALALNPETTGTLSSLSLPKIEVATAPQFMEGKKDCWTPDHLLAGALSASLMTTFLGIAEKAHIAIVSYQSLCFVKLKKTHGRLEASEILIRPTILLANVSSLGKAIELLEIAENNCPVKSILQLNTSIHASFNFLNSSEKIAL